MNVKLVTDAKFITLDRFTLRLSPTNRSHIGTFDVELKTRFTTRPFSIKFKVRVFCEPAIVKKVNCWNMIPQDLLTVNFKESKIIQVSRKREDGVDQSAVLSLSSSPGFITLDKSNCGEKYCPLKLFP